MLFATGVKPSTKPELSLCEGPFRDE